MFLLEDHINLIHAYKMQIQYNIPDCKKEHLNEKISTSTHTPPILPHNIESESEPTPDGKT